MGSSVNLLQWLYPILAIIKNLIMGRKYRCNQHSEKMIQKKDTPKRSDSIIALEVT